MLQPSDDNVPWGDRMWAASKTIRLCVVPVVDILGAALRGHAVLAARDRCIDLTRAHDTYV